MPGACLSLLVVVLGVIAAALIGATAYFWLVQAFHSQEGDKTYRLLVILSAVALIELGVFVNYSLLRWKFC